jgi:hypothetical protein
MMEDKRAARIIISAIIGEKIESLDFSAQERTTPRKILAKGPQAAIELTVSRYDFVAQIQTADARLKTVEIELQKAKLPSDILRFRHYIGEQYQEGGNAYTDEWGHEKARDLYFIFILGYDIGAGDCPVIRYDGQASDVTTGRPLQNAFIQSLHHRSWIVQINQLKERRRNDLEKLLSIFDQSRILPERKHFLDVEDDDEQGMPEGYAYIVRCLRKAGETKLVRLEMENEDFYLKDLYNAVREVGKKEEQLETQRKAIAQKEEELTKKDEELAQEREASAQKDAALAAALAEIERLRQRPSAGH